MCFRSDSNKTAALTSWASVVCERVSGPKRFFLQAVSMPCIHWNSSHPGNFSHSFPDDVWKHLQLLLTWLVPSHKWRWPSFVDFYTIMPTNFLHAKHSSLPVAQRSAGEYGSIVKLVTLSSVRVTAALRWELQRCACCTTGNMAIIACCWRQIMVFLPCLCVCLCACH